MTGAGIDDGDVLVVDRSLVAESGDIIIASMDGKFTVKRLIKSADGIYLQPETPRYTPIRIDKQSGAEFFGVVTFVIKNLHR